MSNSNRCYCESGEGCYRCAGDRMYVRWGICRDCPEVAELLGAGNENRLGCVLDGEEAISAVLRQRNAIMQVVERGERVVGAVVYSLSRDRIEVVAVGAVGGEEGATALLRIGEKLLSKTGREGTPRYRPLHFWGEENGRFYRVLATMFRGLPRPLPVVVSL